MYVSKLSVVSTITSHMQAGKASFRKNRTWIINKYDTFVSCIGNTVIIVMLNQCVIAKLPNKIVIVNQKSRHISNTY